MTGRTSRSPQTSTLKAGDAAPDFELTSHDGPIWKLSESRGKNVVLAFYPFAFSPV